MDEIVTIDRDSDSLIIITADKSYNQSVRWEDTVISVPPGDYKKVINMYWDATNRKFYISVER
jgi:hypothetical protein